MLWPRTSLLSLLLLCLAVPSWAELTDRGTRLEQTHTSSLTEAGTVSSEFVKARPEVHLKKWNGEADLGIRYAAVSGTLQSVRDSEHVTWGAGVVTVEAFPLAASPGMEDGGLELELHLAAKPTSNRFDFAVSNGDQFDWWFQPPLTAEQLAQGRVRPEHVVNSYAVYFKGHRDHITGKTNYGTGKAFHVYRPKLIDANRVETWGTLEYADGVLTVVIPQQALDDAVYPVIIDPTFGYTGVAGSTFVIGGDWLEGTRGTASASGEVDSVSVYVLGGPTNAKPVIVQQSTLTILTNGVGPAASITGAPGWQTLTYSSKPAVSASTDYYACVIFPIAAFTMYFDSTGAGVLDDRSNSYTTPTNPTGAILVSNEQYSLYATYTESGGGGGGTAGRLLILGVE